jgi:hypothetical protein
VDFIIDEGPDTVNMQADSAATLQALGPQFAQQFPELAIELSPLETRLKSMMLKKIQAKQNQPPPPDPRIAAQGQVEQLKAAAGAHKVAEDNSLEWRKAMLSSLTSIEVARIAAKTDQDSSMMAARLEGILGLTQIAHDASQGAADRAHEATQNMTDRAHEAMQSDADRAHEQDMAAQQAAQAQQAPEQAAA